MWIYYNRRTAVLWHTIMKENELSEITLSDVLQFTAMREYKLKWICHTCSNITAVRKNKLMSIYVICIAPTAVIKM